MKTQRVVSLVAGVVGWPLLPVGWVTRFVLELPILGLLLLPLSLVYTVAFLGPLIAFSWLWLRVPLLRLPVAVIGLPWAVLGYSFTTLLPIDPAEMDSYVTKQLFTILWPYSWSLFRWEVGQLRLDSVEGRKLRTVMVRETQSVPLWREHVGARIQADEGEMSADEEADLMDLLNASESDQGEGGQGPEPDAVTAEEPQVDLMDALRRSVEKKQKH